MVARTLWLWLLYAVVGVVILVMAVGGGGDLGLDDTRSRTRFRTKLVGALSGVAIAVAALGAYLSNDPQAIPTVPRLMVGVGMPAAVALSIWSWVWIADDLRRHRGKRA